jgi:uncharacterized protein involved in exopolysaccharide biosynthesis
MTPNSDSTSLRDYLGVLNLRRGLVISVTLIAVLVGIAYSVLRTPIYEATATLDFKDPTADLPIVAPGTGVVPELNQPQNAAANT